MLTTQQQQAIDRIIYLLRSGEKRIKLIGSAGTGKTYLASELVAMLKNDYTINTSYNNGQIYVTAPTNKALAVIQGKIETKVVFKTIHSACKLHIYYPKVGPPTFVKQYKNKYSKIEEDDDFEHAKLGLIDECSMLNTDFLGGMKMGEDGVEYYKPGYLESYNFPIIFIGDDKQLNPVGEPISPIWLKDYPTVELTEIIRQGEGNPIIELSRNMDIIPFKIPKLINDKGYVYSNARHSLIDHLAQVNGTDELKYLAYTNREVNGMNTLVRAKRYGVPKRIEEGETIVFNKPYGNFYTSQEALIEDVEVITDYISIPTSKNRFTSKLEVSGPMDRVKLKYYRINDSFNVLHEHSDTLFSAITQGIKDSIKRYNWESRGQHYMNNIFANITYNHALTVHKAQGSTYKTNILNMMDINFNKDVYERERLLYTAITRASDLIILNNVI